MTKAIGDGRVLVGVIIAMTVTTALTARYFVAEYTAFVLLGFVLVCTGFVYVPRNVSFGAAVWAGLMFGLFLAVAEWVYYLL